MPREAASSPSRRLRSLAEAAANLRSEGLLHAAELVDERRRDVSCGAIGATPASTALAGGAPSRASAQELPTSPRPWERAPPRQFQSRLSAATRAAIAAAKRGEVSEDRAAVDASLAAGKAKKDSARKAKKENLAQASDTLSARHAARKLRGETSTKLEYDGAADADPYATSGKGKGCPCPHSKICAAGGGEGRGDSF